MELPFLNRNEERARIRKAIDASDARFIVIYGRRRCGKSRLLRELKSDNIVYHLADNQETILQISALAESVTKHLPGFNSVHFPSWEAFFLQFQNQCKKKTTLIIDEFPYLINQYPPLDSILQKILDTKPTFNLIICGSSQRMMHGLVLDSSAPLYGRAHEIIKLSALKPGYITDALPLSAASAIEAYSVWGGVPRYWEAASDYSKLSEALKQLLFDKNGVFHNEPAKILADEMRSFSQPHSLLALIGAGCNRLSEIAGRLGKPAINLSKPLSLLIDLGYIKRELPFGESTKSTKRSLYKIADPFLSFWYTYVSPNRSLLELDLKEKVYESVMMTFNDHVAGVWEECARISTAFLHIDGISWKPAWRWWGAGLNKNKIEIDIVAESFDRQHILLGEVKWSGKVRPQADLQRLKSISPQLHFTKGKTVHFALWYKKKTNNQSSKSNIFSPQEVLSALR